MTGIELIAEERQRQIDGEGWTPEHDDKHSNDEMARAAMCYTNPIPSEGFITAYWPWDREWYKPSKYNESRLAPRKIDRVRELVKAGALIAAEIDRLQRLSKTPAPDKAPPAQ